MESRVIKRKRWKGERKMMEKQKKNDRKKKKGGWTDERRWRKIGKTKLINQLFRYLQINCLDKNQSWMAHSVCII